MNYRIYQTPAGQSVVGYGHVADPKTMQIELNGVALGPNTVQVDVYANVPKATTPLWLASFVGIKGKYGKYPIDQAKLDEIAHQYIEMMNNFDSGYSINKPVPPATLTLRVTADGPTDNSSYSDLLGVLSVSTQLWNGPGPGPP